MFICLKKGETMSSLLKRFSKMAARLHAILKIVEEKALGTRLACLLAL